MKYYHFLLTLYLIATTHHGIQAQPNAQNNSFKRVSKKIDSVLQAAVSAQQIPGAVILVAMKGKVLTHKAYGFSTLLNQEGSALLSKPPALSRKHLFDIASLTKTLTTTGILLLLDRGLIQLDQPLANYLPSFQSPDKTQITIRQLLSHSSGLPAWYPLYYRAKNKHEVYELIAKLPLDYPPGSQRRYSDLGFTILGQLIEVVSQKSLAEFMQQEIFAPLGMKSTGYNPLQSFPGREYASTSVGNPYEYRMVRDSALGFRRAEIDPESWNGWRNYNLKGEVNDGNTWYAGKGISGAAGLFSTAEDLYKLASFWLHEGQSISLSVANKTLVREFISVDRFKNGLGWMMDTSQSFMKNAPKGTFGHTGFTGTSMTIIPGRDIIIILLINRQQTGLLESREYYNVNPIRRLLFDSVMELIP